MFQPSRTENRCRESLAVFPCLSGFRRKAPMSLDVLPDLCNFQQRFVETAVLLRPQFHLRQFGRARGRTGRGRCAHRGIARCRARLFRGPSVATVIGTSLVPGHGFAESIGPRPRPTAKVDERSALPRVPKVPSEPKVTAKLRRTDDKLMMRDHRSVPQPP